MLQTLGAPAEQLLPGITGGPQQQPESPVNTVPTEQGMKPLQVLNQQAGLAHLESRKAEHPCTRLLQDAS